jgi:hypothetical protein
MSDCYNIREVLEFTVYSIETRKIRIMSAISPTKSYMVNTLLKLFLSVPVTKKLLTLYELLIKVFGYRFISSNNCKE